VSLETIDAEDVAKNLALNEKSKETSVHGSSHDRNELQPSKEEKQTEGAIKNVNVVNEVHNHYHNRAKNTDEISTADL